MKLSYDEISQKYGIPAYKSKKFVKQHTFNTISDGKKGKPARDWTDKDIEELKAFAANISTNKEIDPKLIKSIDDTIYLFYIVKQKNSLSGGVYKFIGSYSCKYEKEISDFMESQMYEVLKKKKKTKIIDHGKFIGYLEDCFPENVGEPVYNPVIENESKKHLLKQYIITKNIVTARKTIINSLGKYNAIGFVPINQRDSSLYKDSLYSDGQLKEDYDIVTVGGIERMYDEKSSLYLGPYSKFEKEWNMYIDDNFFNVKPSISIEEMKYYTASHEHYNPFDKN
jgi:hypothetical protein